jgi:uncharacterized membrane protein
VSALAAPPSATSVQVSAINLRGDIVGAADMPGDNPAVFYSKGKPTAKVLPSDASAERSVAAGLNDKGDLVGYSISSEDGYRPIFWKAKATTVVRLPALADATEAAAGDINSRGDISGGSMKPGSTELHAVAWDKRQQVVALPEPEDADSSLALAVSNNGVFVGYGSRNEESRGLRWLSKTAQPELLAPLPGDRASRALAGNNKGLAVGESEAQDGSLRPVVWAAGSTTATALPSVAGATRAYATGVNDRGDVVGTAVLPDQPPFAVIWPAGGAPINLNTYVPAGSGIVLSESRGINNKRWILTSGTQGAGTRGFLVKF